MKAKLTPLLITVVGSLLFFTSCRTMFVPNTHNTPLLKKKGDTRISVDPLNLQLAYAASNDIGLIANAQYNESEWMTSRGAEKGIKTKYESQLKTAEIGLGYFKPKGKYVVETYLGLGTGMNNYHRTEIVEGVTLTKNNFSANQLRAFLQGNVGYSNSGFDFIVSLRYMQMKFNIKDTTNFFKSQTTVMSTGNEIATRDQLRKIDNSFYHFIEPGITLRYGKDKVKMFSKTFSLKIFMQSVVSTKLNRDPLLYRNINTCIGAQVGFLAKKSHKKKH